MSTNRWQLALTIAKMERKYPNEWLFIIEPEISENTELLGGIVSVHILDIALQRSAM